MAKNNPVSSVLIASGNAALLTAGQPISALAIGQLGIFNADTHLAINTATVQAGQRFYIAAGMNNGSGVMTPRFSAAQEIQKEHVNALTARNWTQSRVGIFDITDFTVECNTDYGIRIGMQNQAAYTTHGFNTPANTFVVRSSCCATCATCASGDVNDLVYKLATSINNDPNGLMAVTFINTQNTLTVAGTASATTNTTFTLNGVAVSAAITSGDTATVAAGKIVTAINALTDSPFYATNAAGVITVKNKKASSSGVAYVAGSVTAGLTITAGTSSTVETPYANYATFIAANPGVTFGLRITTIPEKINMLYNGSFNTKYDFPRGTVLVPSLVEGFNCSGKITTIQTMAYEQGAGYDVAQLEYMNAGYMGSGNYRQSELTGLILSPAAIASVTGKYVTVTLTYQFESHSGFRNYHNNEETVIVIPCADTTTTGSIGSNFDALFSGKFEAISAYLGTGTCNTTNEVGDIDNAAADGISFLK